MCFRESCNSNFLPGIAETTGVRWRGQGQGEKIYKLIVWICMNYLGSYTGCYTVLLFGTPMWILKTLNFQGFAHVLSSTLFLEALEAFTDKLQRQLAEAGKKERGKVPLRLHTLHQMIITIIAQTQLHEIQSCLLMQPLLFCLDFVIQDRAGLLPMHLLGPEHIKGFGRTACGHRKQPSVQVLFHFTKNITFWYLFRIRSFVQGQ